MVKGKRQVKPVVFAIIPARGGSKGIPQKNIIDIGGFPLLAYSIAAAKLAKKIDRVIVSTDSEKIAEIAKKYGAETPFLRPKKFATDKSPDIDFIKHALEWFAENESRIPDFLVHLRPTTPLRNPADLDRAINLLKKTPRATVLRSGHELRESPYKLFKIKGEYFTGLFDNDPRSEYWNLPRQNFPPVYQPNGYVDIIVSQQVLKTNRLCGNKILPFISPDTGELDTLRDVQFIQYKLNEGNWEIYEYLKKNFRKND